MDYTKKFNPTPMKEVDPVKLGYETEEMLHELAVKTEFILKKDISCCPGLNDRMRFSICQALIWRKLGRQHNWKMDEIEVRWEELKGRPNEEKNTLSWVDEMYEEHKEHYKTSWNYCANGKDQAVCAFHAKEIPKGKGKVRKISGDPGLTEDVSLYSPEGAEFTFYQNGKEMGTVVVDSEGNSQEIALYPGTYTVKETVIPKNQSYALNEEEYKIVIESDKVSTLEIQDPPRHGKIRIRKDSGDTEISVGEAYKIEGAEFSLYKDEMCEAACQVAETGKDGVAVFKNVPLGKWYVKETRAPKGFLVSDVIHEITIQGNEAEDDAVAEIIREISVSDKPSSGEIELIKEPENLEMVAGNTNYSLEGAVYEVRPKNHPETLSGKLVTDKEGRAVLGNLPLGAYTIREVKASPGYKVDPDIKEITIKRDDSKVHVVTHKVFPKEKPKMAKGKLLIEKIDSETGEKMPEGEGTFEGALFKISFFDQYMNEKNTPLKTWIYKTNAEGEINLYGNEGFVSGDPVFTDAFGALRIPLGTFVAEEIRAPEGYLANEEKIIIPVEEKEGNISYEAVTVPEDVLTLSLFKRHGEKCLKGAVFLHEAPDHAEKEITTDDNGKLVLKGLKTGKHSLKEIKSPEGYELLKEPLYFEIKKDGTFSFEDHKEAEWEVLSKNHLSVTVQNRPIPYRIRLHKKDDSGKKLKGAQFTLTDREAYSDTQTTGKEGTLIFEGLREGQVYYLEETRAPKGYRRLKDKNGDPMVYEIKVNNIPVDDVFEAFLDDQRAVRDEEADNIKVSGDKNTPEIEVHCLNMAGQKLPRTGKKGFIILLLAGLGFIVEGRRRRNS